MSLASSKKPIRGEDAIPGRKTLSEFRVIQRNLVYVIGISARIAHENILKEPEYFGQYGKIIKIVVNRRNLATDGSTSIVGNGGMTSSSTTGPSASAYITFVRKDDAARAIAGVDGSVFDGRVLRATYGTTKYCSFYLRGMACTNAGCMYLHEEGENLDSFTKDELQAGKMHLHSYILDKAEAATMKQFGVVQRPVHVERPVPQQQTVTSPPSVISKPATPVYIPEVFTDKTPSSFFERLSKLASTKDAFADDTAPSSPSPPAVTIPAMTRRSFLLRGGFDPFRPADELVSGPVPIGKGVRPPPPPPIGSPISHPSSISGPPGISMRQPLFSESINSPKVARPTEPPHWLNQPSTASMEPSVENFFNLFSHGALGNPTTSNDHSNIIDQEIAASVPSHAQSAPSLKAHNHQQQNQNQETNTQASEEFAFDPKGKSIFEDPAIMQARMANSSQRLVRTSMPSTNGGTAVPKPPQVQPAVQSFTTVKSTKPATAAAIPQLSTVPSKKKAKQAGKQQSSPSLVIQEPVFTNQNAFSALLHQEKEKEVASSKAKKKTLPVAVSPSLAMDPAIISSSTKLYERSKQIPVPRPLDPALLSIHPGSLTDPDQLEALAQQLEQARRSKYAEAQQIESFMRDILKKGWNTTHPASSTSQKQ